LCANDTIFLGYRLSKHKTTICSKIWGGHGPLGPDLATSMRTRVTFGNMPNSVFNEI